MHVHTNIDIDTHIHTYTRLSIYPFKMINNIYAMLLDKYPYFIFYIIAYLKLNIYYTTHTYYAHIYTTHTCHVHIHHTYARHTHMYTYLHSEVIPWNCLEGIYTH